MFCLNLLFRNNWHTFRNRYHFTIFFIFSFPKILPSRTVCSSPATAVLWRTCETNFGERGSTIKALTWLVRFCSKFANTSTMKFRHSRAAIFSEIPFWNTSRLLERVCWPCWVRTLNSFQLLRSGRLLHWSKWWSYSQEPTTFSIVMAG